MSAPPLKQTSHHRLFLRLGTDAPLSLSCETQDTNAGDENAAKKFAALTEAYEILSDDGKRQRYDAYGHAGVDESGGGGGGGFGGFQGQQMSPEDVFAAFEQAFGGGAFGGFGGRRQRGPPRGRDVQVGVTLDLLEAAKGCKKKVEWRSPSAGQRSMEVTIPAGVDRGMNLQLRGEGESGPAGPGNLYISINVHEHTIFERDGADLHMKVRLTLKEALLGASVVIPTLDGQVSLRVPPGTQTGDRRVMTGYGVTPAGRPSDHAGHQYVHFEVLLPKSLSAKQKELIKAFGEEEVELSLEERSNRASS